MENSGNWPDFSGVHELSFAECLYFLMVTMSTVGYGDIVCSTKIGRVFQLLFLGVGLVSENQLCFCSNLTNNLLMAFWSVLPSASFLGESSDGRHYFVGVKLLIHLLLRLLQLIYKFLEVQ